VLGDDIIMWGADFLMICSTRLPRTSKYSDTRSLYMCSHSCHRQSSGPFHDENETLPRWEDNITINLKKKKKGCNSVDWFQKSQDSGQWQAHVYMNSTGDAKFQGQQHDY
jgi:hypothetical protein